MDTTRITRIKALAGAITILACFSLRLAADNPPAPATDPFVKKGAAAAVETSGPQANLVLTYEFYQLPQTEGAELLQGIATDQERYDRLRDFVKQGKARLEQLMCGAAGDGEQVLIQQSNQFPYPIAYFFLGDGAAKTLGAADFKRRNVGSRLVIKAQTIKGGKACDVAMFPEQTILRGFVDQTSFLGSTSFTAPQPVFETRRVNTKPPLLPFDQIRLIGTFNPPASDWGPKAKSQQPATVKDPDMGLFFAHASRMQYDPGAATDTKVAGIDLEMTVYSMDRDLALRILSQPQRPGLAYEGVQTLLKANEAKLEHISVIRSQVGLKSNCSELVEDVYPSGGPDQWITQDVGFNAELRPDLIGNGSTVSLDVTQFQFLNDLGPFQGAGLAGNLVATQPIFGLQSITTKIFAGVGEHALLGTISPASDTGINGIKDDGRAWLAFVRPTLVNP